MSKSKNKDERFLGVLGNPYIQAGITLAAVFLTDVAAALLRSAGIDIEQRFPWTVASSYLLFFAVGNTLAGIPQKNTERYWTRSIIAFILIAFLAGLLALMFSGQNMRQAGSYRWIYIVLTIGYIVFFSIISLMKKIVEFAQREEWNHPRIRKRK